MSQQEKFYLENNGILKGLLVEFQSEMVCSLTQNFTKAKEFNSIKEAHEHLMQFPNMQDDFQIVSLTELTGENDGIFINPEFNIVTPKQLQEHLIKNGSHYRISTKHTYITTEKARMKL